MVQASRILVPFVVIISTSPYNFSVPFAEILSSQVKFEKACKFSLTAIEYSATGTRK